MTDEPEDERPFLPDIAAPKPPRPEKLLAIIQMVAVHSERVVKGEWGCKVTYRIRGSRDIGVVTIVICEKTLWIKTVEWEDIK